MSAHIGDSAALYALGTLNADEHADVETHVATCEACARLLAQACDDVTLMVETQTQHDVPLQLGTRTRGLFNPTRRTGNFRSVALAAAIAIALLPSAYLLHVNRTIEHRMDAEAGLMARMTSSPHRMVAFTGMGNADAKVIYGADGSWYGIIINGASAPLHLLWMHDGQQTMLGTTEQHGAVAMLYLPVSHRMDQLALSDGRTVVAEANLAF